MNSARPLSRADYVALGAVTAMVIAAAYETAIALRWIPLGTQPDEGARFEWFFLIAGGLAMLTGVVVSLLLAVANRRWTPGLALGAVASALVAAHAYTFDKGTMHPGEAPGLGVDIDEQLAAKYPYKRAYLPVNRLEDGTMFNW
jgi:hypothetical protein